MVEHPAVNGRVIGSSPIVGVFFTAFFPFILRHSDVWVPPASPVHSTHFVLFHKSAQLPTSSFLV